MKIIFSIWFYSLDSLLIWECWNIVASIAYRSHKWVDVRYTAKEILWMRCPLCKKEKTRGKILRTSRYQNKRKIDWKSHKKRKGREKIVVKILDPLPRTRPSAEPTSLPTIFSGGSSHSQCLNFYVWSNRRRLWIQKIFQFCGEDSLFCKSGQRSCTAPIV